MKVVIGMEENTFDELLVKGIISGYKDYIQVRKHAFENLVISEAYAYVKSNHIEHQVARHMELFVDYKKQNAGPSWKFLNFKFKQDIEHGLSFIIKNYNYFDEDRVTIGKTPIDTKSGKEKEYLKRLIEINMNYDFDNVNEKLNRPYQLTMEHYLHDSHKGNANEKSGAFNIITYEIDTYSKLLKSIKVWLPNPKTNKAIMLKDLTPTLNILTRHDESYSIDENEVKVLKQVDDEDILTEDPSTFGFEILPEEIEK